jgi:hypothetical protein
MKIAILAVHGVIPQQRYAFQDQVATALRDQLNAAAGIDTGAAAGSGTRGPVVSRRGAGPAGDSMMRGSEPAGAWRMDVVFPDVSAAAKDDPVAAESPSIVRVHRGDTSALDPGDDDVYDVIEAYWSPIDKGKTNAASVLTWLLATVFQPANTTARYEGWWTKGLSDLTYTLLIVAFGLAAFAACALELGYALHEVTKLTSITSGTGDWLAPLRGIGAWLVSLSNVSNWLPATAVWFGEGVAEIGQIPGLFTLEALQKLFSAAALLRLGIGAVGAFLLVQAARAWISVGRQKAALSAVAGQLRARRAFIIGLVVAGLALLYICAAWPLRHGEQMGGISIALVGAAFAFEGLRSTLTNFIAQFFGDVQIYCTHDENSDFFLLRQAILDLVERRLVATLQADYDRVFVFAHSLGSTIALDAIMRIYNLEKERGIDPGLREKLRGFVTFGTALEKTRFFLDTYATSLSASLEEWQGDYYGVLFTPDPRVLHYPNDPHNGIYWANYWYFFDFIADRIASYRSFMKPSDEMWESDRIRRRIRGRVPDGQAALGKIVAQNRVNYRTPPYPWHVLHGDYLSANWFWQAGAEGRGTGPDAAIGALEVVTQRPVRSVAPRVAPSDDDRFDAVPASKAASQNVVDILSKS